MSVHRTHGSTGVHTIMEMILFPGSCWLSFEGFSHLGYRSSAIAVLLGNASSPTIVSSNGEETTSLTTGKGKFPPWELSYQNLDPRTKEAVGRFVIFEKAVRGPHTKQPPPGQEVFDISVATGKRAPLICCSCPVH